MAHVYHWKHGWIPLDHVAALSKAKGNHDLAQQYLKHSSEARGIQSRQDVAKAAIGLPNVPEGDRAQARQDLVDSALRLGHTDVLPAPLRTRSTQLAEQAAAKRAEAQRIADGAGVSDRSAARLSAPGLAQAHRNTDSSLRRFTEAQAAADALEHKAALARSREAEAGRSRLTYEDLQGATHVRDRFGWHRVVRVNKKSVTVATPYSWTETIPIDKVLKSAVQPGNPAA